MFRFTFIVLLMVFASCKKKNALFSVQGVITDQTFSQPLSGATIKLYQIPIGSSDEVLIGSQTADAKGSYSFSFPRDKMEKYILRITKDLYFSKEETINYSELSLDKVYKRNSSTTAMSWAKLTFHNLNPQATDHLQFIKQSGKVNCPECCPSTYQNYYGALDTSIYCTNDGNTNYSYLYWVLNTLDQGNQIVYTTAFDTVEIILNY